MSSEINEFVQEELKKRKISKEFAEMQEKVYEKVVILKAKIAALEEAASAIQFCKLKNMSVDEQLLEFKSQLADNQTELTNRLEELLTEDHKDDLIKILKKTKFIHREPISHKTFNKMNEHVFNIIKETVNEELLLLSPYKVAEIVASERKLPFIEKFLDLYKPEAITTGIDGWIEKFAKKLDEAQQIKIHFLEMNELMYSEDMAKEIAIRWIRMLGLTGDIEKDEETKEAIKEAVEIIRKQAVVF